MEHLLNQQVQNIEISGIRKFFNLVSNEKDIVSLTIGQPDFYTPHAIKQASINAVNNNHTTYTANAGVIELRKAIANYYESRYQIPYHPESEIIVTAGASEAIDITLRTILEPGDEVILPAPIYPGYEPLITLARAKPIHMDTTKTNFKITKSQLEETITEKTKCIIIPSPSNPTGAAYTKKELDEIVSVLKDKKLFILSDEIYSEIIFDQPHVSIASYPEMRDQTIVINGLSKSHSMTGFRIGYALAPHWLSKHMLKVHQYNVSCASSISQYAALEAFNSNDDHLQLIKDTYKSRRDLVYNRLTSMGIDVQLPEGAFYMFPRFPMRNENSFEFGLTLVKQAKVALVPGNSFSQYGEGFMRLSYAYHEDVLNKGLDRIEKFLNQ
ncbi:aminotransferase [Oceanobacillus iheyensis HTE831]|uniref:Aminotransferase n=1 Tax=Oceanobacillus iheyensis (strain DSM 14371 / CIP 107618 / JCM 11309 / KCTC 3954 / HTE831) TaxID=221109 RepID=Q8ERB5_OCEIH|nr:aminotransferase A [Oceanobacillus iheyensis]BAC13347.1 aminotransferase [Oceanobacillus iheyensis HTE831]